MIAFDALSPYHAEICATLHAPSFEEPWDASAFQKFLAMPGAFGYLALNNGTPAGFILLQGTKWEAEILTIAVLPEARRQGIAHGLLKQVYAYLGKHPECENLFLEVGDDNPVACAFYQQAGFEKVGLRKKYYTRKNGQRIDAHVMKKALKI